MMSNAITCLGIHDFSHLGQAWFRKIQELELTKIYRNKSAAGSFLGLPFVPPHEMEDFLVKDAMVYEPKHAKIRKFSEYLYDDNIYFSYCTFPSYIVVEILMLISDEPLMRASLHLRLNGMLYHSHLHIFLRADALLEAQDESYAKMSVSYTHLTLPTIYSV